MGNVKVLQENPELLLLMLYQVAVIQTEVLVITNVKKIPRNPQALVVLQEHQQIGV